MNSNVVQNGPGHWPKVVLYGDSLTQFGFSEDGCYGSIIADKLQRKCDVLNRGFSGYNSRWNQLILPKLFTGESAKGIVAFTILLGANDSNNKEDNPRQHVPVTEFKENLVKMVEYLQSIGVSREKVILISLPPCDTEAWAVFCKDKGKPMAKTLNPNDYSEATKEAAKISGAQFVDVYSAMMKHEDWKTFLLDGLHLSRKGSKLAGELVWHKIEKLTTHLPEILPLWDAVDYENPESYFDKL